MSRGSGPGSCTGKGLWSCAGAPSLPHPLPNKQTGPTENITFPQVLWRVVKIKVFFCLSVRIYSFVTLRLFLGVLRIWSHIVRYHKTTNRDRSRGQNQGVTNINILYICLQKNKCPSLVPSSIRSYVAILQTAGPGRMVFHFLTTMVQQKIAQDRT